MENVLQSGYYESLLGNNNVDWFVDEVIKLKKKNFCFKNTNKDIIMTKEGDKDYRKNNICRLCEKNNES